MSEDEMTAQQVAAFLGISDASVRYAALTPARLPSRVIEVYGRPIRVFKRADVEAYKARTQPDGVPSRGRPKGSKHRPNP